MRLMQQFGGVGGTPAPLAAHVGGDQAWVGQFLRLLAGAEGRRLIEAMRPGSMHRAVTELLYGCG
jgi:hypothetical protein